ncbi:MAG: FecR domain-containing protein [Elusimicrobia bacterium]|nr:FecR domain-containing protein [Elusimicrobiota bacterium]
MAFLASVAFPALAQEKRDIRLVEREGLVWVRAQTDEQWQPLPENAQNIPLEEGDEIKTGETPSRALIQFDKDNTIELESNTEFKITGSNIAWSKFELFLGKIFVKIEEKLKDKKRGVEMVLPAATLAVRGTELVAEAPPDEETAGGVGVFEGSVEATFSGAKDEKPTLIRSGQELTFDPKVRRPKPQALKRYRELRERLKTLRRRHTRLRTRWARLPAAKRKALREKHLKTRRDRTQRRRETRQEMKRRGRLDKKPNQRNPGQRRGRDRR